MGAAPTALAAPNANAPGLTVSGAVEAAPTNPAATLDALPTPKVNDACVVACVPLLPGPLVPAAPLPLPEPALSPVPLMLRSCLGRLFGGHREELRLNAFVDTCRLLCVELCGLQGLGGMLLLLLLLVDGVPTNERRRDLLTKRGGGCCLVERHSPSTCV